MLADRLQRTRTDSTRLSVSVRLTESPITRDVEKYTEVFTVGVKCCICNICLHQHISYTKSGNVIDTPVTSFWR